MKSLPLAILLSLFLILGCVSVQEDSPSAPQESDAEPSDMPQSDGWGEAPELPEQPPQAAEQESPPQGCTVEFQRGIGDTYYVMVKGAEGEVSVRCPDGSDAANAGNSFFCEKLALASPVRAYSSGRECGSAMFYESPKAESGTKSFCTVSVTPSKMVAGDTVTVSVRASTGNSESNLSFDCGEGEKSRRVVGIYDWTEICAFPGRDSFTVAARLNGIPCASANVTVYPTRKGCSVQAEPMELSDENGVSVYSGMIYAHGFSTQDVISYRCNGEVKSVSVGRMQGSADFGYRAECRLEGSLTEPVRVTISKIECGSLLLPR